MEPYQNTRLSPEARAEDLLSRMTLREKIGQLNQRLYGFQIYTREGENIAFTQEFADEVARCDGLGALYGLHGHGGGRWLQPLPRYLRHDLHFVKRIWCRSQ